MQLKHCFTMVVLSGMLGLAGCNDNDSSTQPKDQDAVKTSAPIVIQGAMAIESEQMAAKLEGVSKEVIGGWTFWKGTYKGYPMVISKTRMGMSNSAAATAIAIERYKPIAIINQGTSGGHDPELHVFDIVLGKYAANIGGFITPVEPVGAGSNALTWDKPFDVLPEDDMNPQPIGLRKFEGDPALLSAAYKVKSHYTKGKIVEGTIGSSDMWNNELDRINFLRTEFGTSVEEMETASVAQIAHQFKVPFLGIRILSNNITNDGAFNAATGPASQEYALEVAEQYMKDQASK